MAAQPGHCRIGTSGWSYANWQGSFYAPDLKRIDWLAHYAAHLRTVEINTSFYHLPRRTVLAGWRERTPADFQFAVKAWRAITHYRRLTDCAEPLGAFFERLRALREKCGPVLFQLPPRWHVDLERLSDFLALLPDGRRFAMEFRDPSWHCDAVYDLLHGRSVAFCPFELAELTAPRVVTADFTYVRLHGRGARYRGAYSDEALADWADWLAGNIVEGRDAHVFFDNTDEADHAVRDARRLTDRVDAAVARMMEGSGIEPSGSQKNV